LGKSKVTAIRFPVELLEEMDRWVGKRGRSRFVIRAVERELRRLQQRKAGEEAFGAWAEADYPEFATPEDTVAWISRHRREGDRAFDEG